MQTTLYQGNILSRDTRSFRTRKSVGVKRQHNNVGLQRVRVFSTAAPLFAPSSDITPDKFQPKQLLLNGQFSIGLQQKEEHVESIQDSSYGSMLKFIIPTLGIWLISPILSLVDTSVVGMKCSTQLAALGPGTTLCDYFALLFVFLQMAVTNMTALCLSQKKIKRAGEMLSDALGFSFVLGFFVAAGLSLAAPHVLQLIAGSASQQMVDSALGYVWIRSIGFPAFLVIQVSQSFFLAAKDPVTPGLAVVSAGVINLLGDILLVNFYNMGVAGAAIATAVAQVVAGILMVRALYQPIRSGSPHEGLRVPIQWKLPSLESSMSFFRIAGPLFGVQVTKVVTYMLICFYATSLSQFASGANHVVFSVYLFFAVFGDSMSQCAQTYLPQEIGCPGRAWNTTMRLFKVGTAIALCNGIVAAMGVSVFPWMFTSCTTIVQNIRSIAPLMGFALLIHCCSMISEGCLVAGREFFFLLKTYVVIMTSTLGTLFLLGLHFKVGLKVVWICVVQFQLIRVLSNIWCLNQAKSPLNRQDSLELNDSINLLLNLDEVDVIQRLDANISSKQQQFSPQLLLVNEG